MKHNPIIPADSEVFTQLPRISLADVLAKVKAEYVGTALRDTRSAFSALEQSADIDMADTVATAANLRVIFSNLTPFSLGVGEKRFANIRSCITRAVKRFGQPRTWITKEIPLARGRTPALLCVRDEKPPAAAPGIARGTEPTSGAVHLASAPNVPERR